MDALFSRWNPSETQIGSSVQLISERRTSEQIQLDDKLHFSQDSYQTIAKNLAQMQDADNWLTECIDEALIMVDVLGIVAFLKKPTSEEIIRKVKGL